MQMYKYTTQVQASGDMDNVHWTSQNVEIEACQIGILTEALTNTRKTKESLRTHSVTYKV